MARIFFTFEPSVAGFSELFFTAVKPSVDGLMGDGPDGPGAVASVSLLLLSLRSLSATPPNHDSLPRPSLWAWGYVIALAYFTLHMATATRYGYFRDALYYLACADHLAFGYVDQPPLFPFIAWIARHTLGTSLPALIFWPALAGAARILLVAAFACELGAKRYGVALAAALAATPAVWWVIDHQFAMNAFEAVLWTGCGYALAGFWCDLGPWRRKQIFHCDFCLRFASGTASHARAQTLIHTVAFCGRRRGSSDLPS